MQVKQERVERGDERIHLSLHVKGREGVLAGPSKAVKKWGEGERGKDTGETSSHPICCCFTGRGASLFLLGMGSAAAAGR